MPTESMAGKLGGAAPRAPVERRRSARFPFTADLEALEPRSGTRIHGRVSDLGMGGCYVDTINPFPLGTLLHVRIRRQNESFEAQARVTHSVMHMGMGLVFISAEQAQIALFRKWLLDHDGKEPGKSDSAVSSAQEDAGKGLKVDPGEALHELLVLLARKGILTEEEGNTMLRRFFR